MHALKSVKTLCLSQSKLEVGGRVQITLPPLAHGCQQKSCPGPARRCYLLAARITGGTFPKLPGGVQGRSVVALTCRPRREHQQKGRLTRNMEDVAATAALKSIASAGGQPGSYDQKLPALEYATASPLPRPRMRQS